MGSIETFSWLLKFSNFVSWVHPYSDSPEFLKFFDIRGWIGRMVRSWEFDSSYWTAYFFNIVIVNKSLILFVVFGILVFWLDKFDSSKPIFWFRRRWRDMKRWFGQVEIWTWQLPGFTSNLNRTWVNQCRCFHLLITFVVRLRECRELLSLWSCPWFSSSRHSHFLTTNVIG